MHPYPESAVQAPPQKSFVVTWLLSWLLGGLGADRFYLGKIGTGVLKLVTLGGFGLWYLIDLIMVLAGAARDSAGRPLEGSRSSRTVAWVVTAAGVILGGVMGIVLGAVAATGVQEAARIDDDAVIQEDDDAEVVEAAEEEPAEDAEEGAADDEAADAAREDEEAEEAEETEDPEEAQEDEASTGDASWLADQFGEFEMIEESGSGDAVISLPEDGTGGIVTAEHSGSSNFALTVLDAQNQSTAELLVNTIGQYSGSTAWGVMSLGDGVSIQVSADGPWSITVEPFSAAEPMPGSGSGDGVYLYDGGAATLHVTHNGQSNFVVTEETDDLFNLGLLINEIGPYEGSVAIQEGPSLIVVQADGEWTLSTD
ncbi:TM2 domain-containing protein [Nesterenkonia sp. K-15-9-6]|uniref:TM2 domain-containing protein n=1 Tax=Nesterenkonia sp. K-15-9-6 TaxID=3093918 RepID=UPI0040444087